MIGIDIVRIDRFKDTCSDFAKRILSDRESIELDKRNGEQKYEYIAGRFAAKEAYYKATKNKNVDARKIEVLNDCDGSPHLYVNGKMTGEVSISHDTYAIAIVEVVEE